MAKLKCWKNVEKRKDWNTFYRKKDSKNIFVFKEKKINKWYVDLDTGKPFRIFKTKPQAIKFAKSYMKKHDTC